MTRGLDAVAKSLGLRPGLMSSPELFTWMLDHELHMADFPPFRDRVVGRIEEPFCFDAFIARVQAALERGHPMFTEALLRAQAAGLLEAGDQHPATERMLHFTWLVEQAAEAIATDPEFLVQLNDHVEATRTRLGLHEDLLGFMRDVMKVTDGAIFEGAKIRTLDLVIRQYLDWRARDEGPLDAKDVRKKNRGLKLNMVEAVATDTANGFLANARVGAGLTCSEVLSMAVSGPNKIVKQVFDEGWTDEYHSWNFAFLLGNVEDLDIVLPKLLAPTVLEAAPDDYLFLRGTVLWLVVNLALFTKVRLQQQGREREQQVGDAKELAHLWGRVNRSLARQRDQEEDDSDEVTA